VDSLHVGSNVLIRKLRKIGDWEEVRKVSSNLHKVRKIWKTMEWESSVLELMFLDCCKKNNRSFQVCECRPPFWDDLLLKVESFTVYGDCVLHMHKLIQLFLAMQTWFICIRISAVYVGRICCIFKCMYAYWCICM